MTISRHLKTTLFLLIGITIAVGLVGLWVRMTINAKAYDNLARQMTVQSHLEAVRSGVLTALDAEKRFLLRYGVDGLSNAQLHVAAANGAIAQTRLALESIAELTIPETLGSRLREDLKTTLALFEVRLKRMVLLVRRKGDAQSGLVWEMHRMAEGLERYISKLARIEILRAQETGKMNTERRLGLQELNNHLLFIRRWEKDYFLRDDLRFISSVQSRVGQVEASFAKRPFQPRERERILTYLKTYLIYFERIALNDVQLLEERNQINQTADTMRRLVQRLSEYESANLVESEAQTLQRGQQITLGLLGLFVVIVIISSALAIRLTRRITGSLDTLVQATEQLGDRGDCPTIHLPTQDEFARLADAFNGMVENLRRAQRQLIQSEKLAATGKLSASIAHEINNPLFGIQGCLERILKRLPGNDTDRRLVDLAIRECQRIARLVHGLRHYHSTADQTMAQVDLLAVLDDVFLINGKYLQQARVDLVRELPESLPLVNGTRDQLQMVFVNLVTNSVEAMPGGGTFTVSVRQEAGMVALRFTDTGRGIDAEEISQVFEPFFSTKPEVKGVGLGLSISYGIIKRHGGDIQVTSEPGHTEFLITLPVSGEEVVSSLA